ncbi:uncharacterized protein LOC133419420 [Cololabis saira]|uniref:uncharacterized protein LOC133419420 n=1 Tax=Cololabis saira TaxID=129043 RepID=UPI002AD48A89|nr:uncharacterized protein LOC133419420 [Cololabis saira]
MGSTTLSRIVMETCTALTSVLQADYLKTPSTDSEWKSIARDFERKWQFPHCLGAVDAKRIFLQPPAKRGSKFHNHRSRFSIVLTAVVDANYTFVYASAGTPGRESDPGVFHPDLTESLDTGTLNFPPDDPLPGTDVVMPYTLIGDEAFPLRPDLMKPFPLTNLNHDQKIYNYRLSRARRVVENAFGILANRFRVLRTTLCLEPDKVVSVVSACLCLHNFLLQQRCDAYAPPGYVDGEDAEHGLVEGAWRTEGELECVWTGRAGKPSVEAEQQREALCHYFLSPAGRVWWQAGVL